MTENDVIDPAAPATMARMRRGTCSTACARVADCLRRLFRHRFGGLVLIGLLFLAGGAVIRTVLLVTCDREAGLTLGQVIQAYAVGFFYDLVAYFYCMAPAAMYTLFLPDKLFRSTINRVVLLVFLYLVILISLIDGIAEWLFWEEFGSRFNFIAVDYLVYTHEVTHNITESYPVPAYIWRSVIVSLAILAVTAKGILLCSRDASTFRRRLAPGLVFVLVPLASWFLVDSSLAARSSNRYAAELSKNGLYGLFAAFRGNTIAYDTFYVTEEPRKASARLRELVRTSNSTFTSDNTEDITRRVTYPGPPRECNVVIFTVESLSARFLGTFGNAEGLTPHLDALAKESLLFTRLYATGTRTVRGLEAIATSLPPTPGRSIVKRPGQPEVFSLPGLLRRRGYDACFLYGGRGYFDNMNAFFETNGCRTVDQSDMAGSEVTFTNAWGVCDEDLFRRTLKEADAASRSGKPFFQLVMTTSNHRPFTYPQHIDTPSGSGREGAVKYTDFAFGAFFQEARRRPWFDNTLFVIVADHCAGSAGRTTVPLNRYHIPLFLYAPKFITPGRCDALCSQIDIAPTILGVLRMSYVSRFFGKDVLHSPPNRALPATYQDLGLYADGTLTLLGPNRKAETYDVRPDGTQTLTRLKQRQLQDTVSYYQTASHILKAHHHTPE